MNASFVEPLPASVPDLKWTDCIMGTFHADRIILLICRAYTERQGWGIILVKTYSLIFWVLQLKVVLHKS
jgi:hypothetical protein